ncbi:Mrp/NBP35 family ATP-binding protein [Frigidibacter sp. MR17.24]|uniref:Mrp/NBP35 family ATP-binding protein n=1 Tax=Frigidibacter sp. MR17.24 TaxID=3127345 RepID=UPI0030131550
MRPDKTTVLNALARVAVPGGGDIVGRDMVRALTVADAPSGGGVAVGFVLELPEASAPAAEPLRAAAEAAVAGLEGVASVRVATAVAALTPQRGGDAAPGTAPGASKPSAGAAPSLKIGGHPTPQEPGRTGPQRLAGIDRILAVASGKGGVGKSTVSSNLAVALAREGRRVGLLDADIYGPSQPRMMGVNRRPASPDGKSIEPLHAHGVTLMSIGFMLKEEEAVVWRGPMLMGALQQLLTQVQWGALDVLIVDLPPGTGDVQLTLCQRTALTGALVVSTPQDVALLDARRAIDMFGKLKTPVLGLIENMSTYVCPNCGHEAHLFGHGGVGAEAERLGLPFLGEIPLSLDIRLAGDAGTPVAAGEGPEAEAYRRLAQRLVAGGMG